MTARHAQALRRHLCALLLLAPAALSAQQLQLPQIDRLRLSSAPAFVLLGVSPASVNRPATPTDLGLDLARRAPHFQSVPTDFALETSPYWLLGHPALTWRDDTARTVGQSLARTFSVSAATAELGDSAAPNAGLAFGIRVLPLSGHLSAVTRAQFDTLERALGRENELYFQRMAAERARLDSALTAALRSLRQTISDPATLAAAQEAVRAQYQSAKEQMEARIFADSSYQVELARQRARRGTVVPRRVGTMLELAAAGGWGFPGATWARGRFRSAAAWAALSYEGPKVTPILLVRFQSQGDTLPNLLDAGGRLVRDGERWGISFEGVVRRPLLSGSTTLYRVAGMLEYEVIENTWVVGTFGRDYQTHVAGSALAQLGVKLNVNHERYAQKTK